MSDQAASVWLVSAIDRPAAQEFSPKNPLRVKTNLSSRINVICPVQISLKKYSA
jgi:hypothetical protein